MFLIFLVFQHIGGVITLLQGKTHNPNHRKFAVVVTNLGRIVTLVGFKYAKQDLWFYILSVLAVLLLIGSVQAVFGKKEAPKKENKSEG